MARTIHTEDFDKQVEWFRKNLKSNLKNKQELDNLDLERIGENIASGWGGNCINFEIDNQNETVIFYCIEHGEEFITEIPFSELKDYDY